jgi:NADPH:quinone reductase-like Zn-dependent oxidoreductase
VSLNYRDQLVLKESSWRKPDRGLVPIADGSGEIDAMGPGVENWAVGDRVTPLYFRDWLQGPPHANMGMGLGSLDEDGVLSEYVILPARRLTRAPKSLSHAEASTLPCAALTAWSALHDGGHRVGADSKVLVLGSGGVSLFALVLARAAGARVIATSSQDAKLRRMKELGASEVLNYRNTPDWGREVTERYGGVDLVVNPVGTGVLDQTLAALRPGGEVAIMGLIEFSERPLDVITLMSKNLRIRGISVGNAEMHAAMVREIDAHRVRPPIDRTFRFEDAREAYRAQASADLFGKIVIELA